MWLYIVLGIVALIALFVIVVMMRPADFRISRSATMAAPPADVFAQVNDFHKWDNWSPWAKLDPNCKNTFEGAQAGVGAGFHWSGNSRVGEGSGAVDLPQGLLDGGGVDGDGSRLFVGVGVVEDERLNVAVEDDADEFPGSIDDRRTGVAADDVGR